MKYIMLEHYPTDSRLKIASDGTCQTLTSRMGTGGGNVPIIIAFRKSRRAKDKEDYETWVESDIANTINTFDVGDTRATTVVINEDKDIDREKVL